MTTLFGTTSIPIEAPKKKRTLLPLLTVVFLGSYGLMTMLIVEQGATIQAQRNLIQVLLGDSKELWSMKGKVLQDKQMAQAQAQAQAQGKTPSTQGDSSEQTPSNETPSTQAPSNQTPSTQAPATQNPSTQATPQHRSPSRGGKTAKPQTQAPPTPASDFTDQRRTLRSI